MDWVNVLWKIIGTIVVVGIIPYLVWRKQYRYKQESELYNKLMPILGKLEVFIEISFERRLNEKEKSILPNLLEEELYPLTEEVRNNFGNLYVNSIKDLMNLLYDYAFEQGRNMSREEFKRYVKKRTDIFISLGNKYRKKWCYF